MKLYFAQDKIPRTTTREQWKDMWRWKRVTERDLRDAEEFKIECLRHPAITPLDMQRHMDLIDSLVNPPLLVPPWA